MITSRFARALSLLPRLLAATLFHGACVSASLQAQTIVHEFFVPMPEAQMRTALATIEPGSGVVGTSISSVISVVVAVQGTKVVYDHWEDGYEVDLNNPLQATTQIWGDGNDANGKPPGFANDPASFASGAVLALESVVNLPRNPAELRYDGRDLVGATRAVVMTRTGWPLAPGPVLGGSIEVTPTIDYGTSYVSPVGTDVSANQMFEYAGLFIMARDNGTSVTIDVDGAGPAAAVIVPLNRGESHLVNNGIKKGATVMATKPVQVDLVTGDIGGRYETNWMTLFPVNQWTTTYYSPVGTAANGNPAVAYLYNDNAAALTVTATSNQGAVSFAIPAKGVYAYTIPKQSGVQMAAAAPFFGIVMVGADPARTSAHDWGFTLVPADSLTSQLVCGWGPGSADLTANGSPVWVTPAADTRLYVDFNGDGLGALTDPKGGKYDQHFDLSALASRTLYDPDLNQTAMRVYTMNGARLAGAWGQDPAVAGTGNPYLDVGTGLLPFPIPQLEKSYRIFQDNGAPGLSLLDVLEYTIRIDNRGLVSLGNIPVVDALPSGISYVAGSSARDGIALLDNGSGTPFPLDAPGYNIPSLLRRGSTVFTYRATITSTGQISNTATSTSLGLASNAVVNVAGGGTLAPVIQFTDGSGAVQATYPAGGGIYVTLTDAGANLNGGAADTVSVLVRNTTSGDLEFVLLTETGPATGVFRNTVALASSSTAGNVEQDGTLYAEAGDALAVAYTDALYGLSASAAAQIATPTLTKQLYLQSDGTDDDASGHLNRNDPVSLGLTTTAATQALQAAATPVLATIAENAPAAAVTLGNAASQNFNYNAGPDTDANRVLLVGVTFRKGNGGDNRTVSSVTYAGVAMTPVGSANNNKHQRAYLYALVNPPAGTGSTQVAITWSAALANGAVVGAVCYKGVDPLLNSAVTATDDSDPALTVPTAAGSLVVGVAGGRTATAGGYSVSSPGSALWSRVAVSGESVGSAQTQPGVNGTVILNWTADNAQWAAVGLSLNPAHLRVPVVGQPQSYLTGDVSSSTNAYDSGSTGSNRMLLVGITYRNATGSGGNDAADEQVSSVTYGGDALTKLGEAVNGSDGRVYLYYRASPKTGSNSLVVNWDSTLDRSAVVGAVTFANVDPTTPFGTLQSATGDSNAPAVTGVASAASDRVFGLVGGRADSNYALAGSPRNAGTLWSASAEDDHSVGYAQLKPGVDGSVSLQWSGSDDPWAALGVAIKPAPSAGGGAGGTVTFTQTPDFQKDFILPLGGTVSVVTHVNVTSGTLPANPAVEAVLAHDGTPFATLSSPVYNSVAGTLTWTGTLASALTVPAGEAIDLTLTTSESAAFKVEYGSQNHPSRINLPTTTVIAIDSLGVYDAPYPGGTPVSSGINGTNLYVRVQVSDPFGAYDVTSVDLNLDGPGSAGDVSTTLGQAQVVASAGAVKTYEYVWSTNLTEGSFNVAATAHEGTEGTITDTTALALSLSTMDGGGTPAAAQFTATANGLSTSLYPVDTTLHLRVTDLDQNLNGGVAETLTVTVVAGAGDQETVTLTETGPNTGIFVGSLAASGTVGSGNGNGTLLAPVGTALNLSYVDPTDASDTAVATALVTPSSGPVIGNSVTVTKLLLNRPSSRARVGETVQYRVLVVNNGDTTLNSVAVTDTYPADKLQFNLASVVPSAAGLGTLTWANVGPLAPGASVTLDLDFTALASAAPATNAVLANAGSVSASTSVDVTLVDPKVTVSKTVVTPVPPATAQIGDVVTFSINVTNSGDTAITTLPLEDSYSGASFELVSASVPPDSSGYGSLLWNDLTGAGSLAPGASLSVDVLLRVKGAADPASNVATADFAQDEYGYTLSAATSTASLTLLAAKVSGTVYDDLDQSGGFTAGDVGLEGVAVRLFTDPNGDGNPADGVQVGYAETGVGGGYEFVNLAVGKYVVAKTGTLLGYVSSSPTSIAVEVASLIAYPDNNFFDYFDTVDSRALAVTSVTVNEASPNAVFTVTGFEDQEVRLSVLNGTTTGLTVVEYFNGSAWVFASGAVTLPTDGDGTPDEPASLLVRVKIAPEQDAPVDDGETFQLLASNSALVAYSGTGTIRDNGTGSVFLNTNNTAIANDPGDAGFPPMDDDRPLAVTDPVVSESADHVIFDVAGAAGQKVKLELSDYAGPEDSADTSGFVLFYRTGYTVLGLPILAPYVPGSYVEIPELASTPGFGILPVYVEILSEHDLIPEGREYFNLTASTTSGTSDTGLGIIADDGSVPGGDDDRQISVSNVTVNEASSYMVFELTGREFQFFRIDVESDVVHDPKVANVSGFTVEVLTGGTWTAYDHTLAVPVFLQFPNDGDLDLDEVVTRLVRVKIDPEHDDVDEGTEVYHLEAYTNSGVIGYGHGSIKDDGTGGIFLAGNITAVPNDPGDSGYPAALDDDRVITIASDRDFNEGSPYAGFTVSGAAGQQAQLTLTNGTTSGLSALQYYDVDTMDWVNYTAASYVTLPASGQLQVRVNLAPEQDSLPDNGEQFVVAVNNSGGVSRQATGTLRDDGTGAVFLETNSSGTPNASGDPGYPALLDDDRVIGIASDRDFNEASPYAVFVVSGVEGQSAVLTLTNSTTTGLSGLQYFNGAAWVNYGAGPLLLPDDGDALTGEAATRLVRVALTPEQETAQDDGEQFIVAVATATGVTRQATGTIRDNGSGAVFLATNTTGSPDLAGLPVLDDDRPLTVSDVAVNEASPFAIFSVGGAVGQRVTLSVADVTTAGLGAGLEYNLGAGWVFYTGPVTLTGTSVLVRVPITPEADLTPDNNETFSLLAANTGGTSYTGTGTVKDDGSGGIFLAGNSTGVPDASSFPDYAMDDDRLVLVSDASADEDSTYIVQDVAAAAGQWVALSVSGFPGPDASATTGGFELFYQTGVDGGGQPILAAYPAVSTGGFVQIPAVPATPGFGLLKVFVKITSESGDGPEGAEKFLLTAESTSGTSHSGIGTIYDAGTIPGGEDYRLIAVSDVVANEASEFMNFTVTGRESQYVLLDLVEDVLHDPLQANSTGFEIQVLGGTGWEPYARGSYLQFATDGDGTPDEPIQMLVRIKISSEWDADDEGAEVYHLEAITISGLIGYGHGTIRDDGTGAIFLAGNQTVVPNAPGDPGYPAVLDDDRLIGINNVAVNEASAWAVFTVTGREDQLAGLSLANVTTAGLPGPLGIQYYDGSTWQPYAGGYLTLPNDGDAVLAETATLLVRVDITPEQDALADNGETFRLTATNTGGVDSLVTNGVGTIQDDGTGGIYLPGNTTGTPDATGYPGYLMDDDRAIDVNDPVVAEASTHAVFSVSGAAGQWVQLSLADHPGPEASATSSGFVIYYQSGVDLLGDPVLTLYTPGSFVQIPELPASPGYGILKVHVEILSEQDAVPEGAERFALTAVTTSGTSDTGTATIYDDGTVPPGDDDRVVTVSDVTVNEASEYATFTVTGHESQYFRLALVEDLIHTTNKADISGFTVEVLAGGVWVSYPLTTPTFLQFPAEGGTADDSATMLARVRIVTEQDPVDEGAEMFHFEAFTISNEVGYGHGTIIDDGTGAIFLAGNLTATPNGSMDPGYPAALDDDRIIAINNLTVNEASPYAVFILNGYESQTAQLQLLNVTTELLTSLECYVGGTWVGYGSSVTFPTDGDAVSGEAAVLLVRVALSPEQETPVESDNNETFRVKATTLSGTESTGGIGTIVDDGTGAVFLAGNTTGLPNEPLDPGYPILDDDRQMTLTSVTVNEASPFAFFTLTGVEGQLAELDLINVTTSGLTHLEYYDGSAWQLYDSGEVTLPTVGAVLNGEVSSMLLRVTLAPEQDTIIDNNETFRVLAWTLSGVESTGGLGTIRDDGTGDVFNSDGSLDLAAVKDLDGTAQTICFRAPAAASRHEVLPLTAATATSGLRVQFSVVSGPATVAGNLVSFTGTGAVVVRASQPGDAIYQAAPTVDQTIQALDISIPTGVQAGWRATHAEGAANATAMAVAVELNDPTGAPGSAATHVAVAGYVTNASGNRDLYVARYNAVTGARIWWKTYVGTANGDDEANAVAVDSQGNVIVAGEVARAAGNSDILVAKYAAADGTQLWVQTYAGTGAADYGEDGLAHYDYYDAPGRQPLGRRNLAVGADGSVVVGGYVTNAAGNLDLVVLKYGSAGNFAWRGDYDLGMGNDYAHAVAVDSAGNVYATGGSNGTTLDAVTVKFDAAGTRLWAQRYDNGKPDKMLTLLLDKDEHPVVGGYTQEGTFNMVSVRYNKAGDGAGGTTILWEGRVDHPVYRSSDSTWDMSLVQGNDVILTGAGYSSAGAFNGYTLRFPDQCATVLRWGVDYNGPANKQDQMVAMGADVFGNPVVTGYSQNADGSYDIYTAKYRAEDGSFLWAQRLDGAAGLSDEPTAVAVDPSGNVFVAGYTTVAGGTTELLVQSYRAYDDPARQAQTITFANPGAQQAGTPLTLAATSSSGLPVQLSVIDGPAVLNGNLLTFTGIGSVTVRAWQPGSGDYLAAVPVDQTFTVSKSPQTIHFALPATIYRVNGAWEPWPLTAVATSGLPVNYTVTAGTATINSGVLTLGAIGAVTVQASQAGDHRFLAAANVTATVTGVDLGTIVIPNTLTLNWRDRSLLDPALSGSIANGEGNALALHEAPAGHADSAYVAGFVLAANGKKDLLLTRYNQVYTTDAPPVDTGVGQQVWTRTLNGPADGDDEALAVAVDSNGNVAVAGYRTTTANGRDLHVAKFNAAGDLQWQYTYNGTANSTDTAVAVAFEGTNKVVVGGYVTNTGTGRDFFAAKLDIDTGLPLNLGGVDTWERSANRAASHPDTPVEMVVGTDGGVVLAGGSGPLLSSYASQSDYTFAVKFAAADGALAWSRAYSYSASSPDTLTGLALDSANNVIVSGYSRRANYDIYTAKYAANTGALIWENYFNGGSSDATWDVAVDRSGNAFVAGSSYADAGVRDGITLKLNGVTGAEIWNRKPYGTGLVGANDENFTVNLDVLGNAVVTGYTTLVDATKDVYLSKNNSATGAILHESGFDGYYGRDDSIKQVKVDPKGNVWMTGFTTDTTGQRKILVVRLFP